MTYDPKTKTYSLSTTKAFDVLSWETAATYGGSTFKVVDGKWQMLSQDYHYDLRPWNSKENIFRNLANEVGKPRAFFSTGQKYLINVKY
jgi:hypothetical protein